MMYRTLTRFAFFFAALAILAMANLPDPPQIPGELSDKAQHMLAFAVLSALARAAWPATAAWKILVLLAAFGAIVELLQAAAGLGRDPSMADWLADVAAIALVLIAIAAARIFVVQVRRFFPSLDSTK